MKTDRRLSGFLILAGMILGVVGLQSVHAQGIEVNSADPNTAEQGTSGLDVTISGNGFKNGAKLRFIIFDTEQEGGIKVNRARVLDQKTILANIDVLDDAEVNDYNIEVTLRNGRKGKGTNRLFAVKVKKDVYSCGEVFALNNDGNCNCEFDQRDQTGQQGTPPLLIWGLQGDCDTHETLVIPQFEQFADPNGFTLTARIFPNGDPFAGSSVVAAAGHRAAVTDLKIDIGPLVAAGCAGGELRSAVAFVLDAGSINPHAAGFIHTWWTIGRVTINHDIDPLCHAMEFSRTDAYNILYPDTTEGRVTVGSNVINAGSYEKTGILFRGFERVNDKKNAFLKVGRNTIGPAAAAGAADANAIQFGPIIGVGSVERNMISLDEGTGVLVLGDELTSDVAVTQNDVAGASVGVLVDNNVPDATIKSNILTGDNGPGSVGVCSAANSNKIHANKISDFEDAELQLGCSGLVSPAE
jgi:hypothetical protein